LPGYAGRSRINDGSEATFARMKALGVGWAMQDAIITRASAR
jgi:hypothetical protein